MILRITIHEHFSATNQSKQYSLFRGDVISPNNNESAIFGDEAITWMHMASVENMWAIYKLSRTLHLVITLQYTSVKYICVIVIIMSYSYQETLNGKSLSRYKSKFSVINCKECPYKLSAGVWENNTCKWPDLQYGDVYSYLIESSCTLPFFL